MILINYLAKEIIDKVLEINDFNDMLNFDEYNIFNLIKNCDYTDLHNLYNKMNSLETSISIILDNKYKSKVYNDLLSMIRTLKYCKPFKII